MSCNCSPSTGPGLDPETEEPLPSVGDVAALEGCATTTVAETDCSNPDNVGSNSSAGTTLEAKFTDARCLGPNEKITLLGRVGNTLAKFTGSGFLQVVCGQAKLVTSLRITVRQLWHRWFRTAGGNPVTGDPHPFPYGIVANKDGDLFGIQGLATADSTHVWNFTTEQWETWKLSELPHSIQRRLDTSNGLELVGYDPVPESGDQNDVRELKALMGEGIVYLEKVAVGHEVAEGCTPCPSVENFAYKARVLAFPTLTGSTEAETGRYRMIYSGDGLHWEHETSPGVWADA